MRKRYVIQVEYGGDVEIGNKEYIILGCYFEALSIIIVSKFSLLFLVFFLFLFLTIVMTLQRDNIFGLNEGGEKKKRRKKEMSVVAAIGSLNNRIYSCVYLTIP